MPLTIVRGMSSRLLVWGFLLAVCTSPPSHAAPPPTREQIEADWLRQDTVRDLGGAVRPEEDALGGCDGTKDGKWGFHTALEDDPWWQIDLGQPTALARMLVYNRGDGTAGRAARLKVLLSPDGAKFDVAYQHDGTVFRGQPDNQPLAIQLAGHTVRYVRIQLPGNNCLHLDEVEIFPVGEDRNIALHQPATQSSVCEWSVRKTRRSVPPTYPTVVVIEQGLKLATDLAVRGADVERLTQQLQQLAQRWQQLPSSAPDEARRSIYLAARWAVRELALSNPLLDFKDLLLATCAPPLWSHMSDQYLGWWSQPGGNLYVLEDRPPMRSLPQTGSRGLEVRRDAGQVLPDLGKLRHAQFEGSGRSPLPRAAVAGGSLRGADESSAEAAEKGPLRREAVSRRVVATGHVDGYARPARGPLQSGTGAAAARPETETRKPDAVRRNRISRE